VINDGDPERDLTVLVVPQSGRLVATGNRYEPYRLLDPDGVLVEAVTAYFRDLLAAGRAESLFVWDGSAAVVSVPVVRHRYRVGSGDSHRGP
jgi:hypothetical protein